MHASRPCRAPLCASHTAGTVVATPHVRLREPQGSRCWTLCCGEDPNSLRPGEADNLSRASGSRHCNLGACTAAKLHACLLCASSDANILHRYALYSSATMFVATLGAGSAAGFTLDTTIGEFVATHPGLRIPPRGALSCRIAAHSAAGICFVPFVPPASALLVGPCAVQHQTCCTVHYASTAAAVPLY